MTKWYGCGLAIAVLVGHLASLGSTTGWAPVGLYSLGVGLAIGVPVAILAAAFRIACTKRLLVGTAILAIFTVIAQHAWLYNDYRRQWHEVHAREPALALFRAESGPLSVTQYFAAEATPEHLLYWCVDAALIVTAAVGTVWVWQRQHK